MNLLEFLKQIKMIEPDADYSEAAKRSVLASPTFPAIPRFTARQILARMVETGFAVGLGILLIIFITGGFSGTSISPMPFAAVNPSTLRAEAQAVDMQIQLANLVYQESSSTVLESGTPAVLGSQSMSLMIATSAASSSLLVETSTLQTTSSVSVDDALKALSQ
jgi:hypothetical protein